MRSPGLIKDLIGVIIVMRFRRGIAEETRNSERGRGEWEWLGRIDFERSFGTSYNTRCKYLTERICEIIEIILNPCWCFFCSTREKLWEIFTSIEEIISLTIPSKINIQANTFLKKFLQIPQGIFTKILKNRIPEITKSEKTRCNIGRNMRTNSYNLYIAVERIRFSSASWTRRKSASISWDGLEFAVPAKISTRETMMGAEDGSVE